MEHGTPLISTIAYAFVAAFVGGTVATWLRMSPIVGYLLAGVAVGPFTPGFVADGDLAGELAEIGVMLLMFGVGMHFSIRDLLSVRAVAVPGAVGQILVATALGMAVAHFWGWSLGGGLVFGLSLSVASTVVLLRALGDRNMVASEDGRIAVGWLIVEDLVMVLILVLLPALAVSLGGEAPGLTETVAPDSVLTTLALSLGGVVVFVGLMLVVGTRFFPWLLDTVASTGSDELFTLGVVAVAIGIAYGGAELFGVSFALGAFFAGVVIHESGCEKRAARDLQPLQDIFAVLFFVSVGMLFDPMILVRQPLQIVAVVAIILVGKSLAAFVIVVGLRRPVGTALTVSASLAQIGEFSFILAGLGVSLGLLPAEGLSLIVAGALLSITLNPVAFQAGSLLAARLARPGEGLP